MPVALSQRGLLDIARSLLQISHLAIFAKVGFEVLDVFGEHGVNGLLARFAIEPEEDVHDEDHLRGFMWRGGKAGKGKV